MAAPAVAVVGALAAAPHLRDHGAATAGHHVAASTISAARMGENVASDLAKVKAAYRRHAKAATHHHAHHTKPVHTAASTGRHAGPPSGGQGAPPPKHTHHTGRHSAPVCSPGAGGLLPENYATIVAFLTEHGYTGVAAAGIAGNIYQESRGNPEAGGSTAGGLIGWTPLPGGYITGNPATDLQTQLSGILTFNEQFPADIPLLNDASSPARAADIYVTDFEHAGVPAAGTREASAEDVARACGL